MTWRCQPRSRRWGVDFGQAKPYTPGLILPGPRHSPPHPLGGLHFFLPWEKTREAYLSTQPSRAQTPPRFSQAHGDCRRPARSGQPARQGPQETFGLTGLGRGRVMTSPLASPLAGLKRRGEFLRIARSRKKHVAQGLILQSRAHDADQRFTGGVAGFRVGFTVSRKVGNAVRRNRARRRLRAAAERVLPDHAMAGFDFVIIGRWATPERPFDQLLTDLTTALQRLGVYRQD